LSKASRTSLFIAVPLALAIGFGLGCVTQSGEGKGPSSNGDTSALEAELADTKAELADTKAELADNKAQLVEAQAELALRKSQLVEADALLVDVKTKLANVKLVRGRFYLVTKVVDGDTFELGKHKVRLLGVNTPESVHPAKPVDWFGVESSNHMKKLLKGKKVRLEPEKGKILGKGAYGRMLAYAFLEDGTDVNRNVVRGGYGQSYHKYPCKRRAEFDELQAKAESEGIGLWDDKGRLAWEDTHIIPDVPQAEAQVIVSKSGMVHDVQCGAGPDVKNGTFFRDVKQAAKFRFTKLHSSCLKGK
jgi:endonuclease YncB( thermonuclease family)